MPKSVKNLTVKQLNSPANSSATKSKPDRIADGNGLWIYKYPSSKKTWYSRYTIKGKGQQTPLLIGDYPEMSITDARAKNAEIRKLAKSGINPKIHFSEQTDLSNTELTFEFISNEWLESRVVEHKKDNENIRRLKANILPVIGKKSFVELDKKQLQDNVINPIVDRKAYAEAKRNKDILKLVFDFGIDKYDLDINNPATRLKYPNIKGDNFPALTSEKEVQLLVKDIWSYREKYPRSNIHVEAYLKLAILLFVRPSELRTLTWDCYDKDDNTLNFHLSKTDTQQTIILSKQANDIFVSLYASKFSIYIFPSHLTSKVQPISDNTARVALNKLGYEGSQTIHGFRATARTLLDERLEQDVRYIENQLGHVPKDSNGKAYNRTQYVNQRKDMLQLWSDYLDALRLEHDIEKFIANNL